ncbi:MAG: hypothetical protein PSV17_00475 [Methylotenera sp.]|uniref:plasmid mobilization protein n=1 Tax=Methylotenera sp. TaxID=2051956 RepID=UPI002486ECA9|nr:hypothetical protein [Methylotenera sp.]MDI1307891.1 hypothetical protein [Methylotenera sp.]
MANNKNEVDRATKVITFRVTQSEFDRVSKMADSGGVSVSKLMRAAYTGNTIRSRSDEKAISELRRQGGLLKHILVLNKDGATINKLTPEIVKSLEALIPQIQKTILNIAAE